MTQKKVTVILITLICVCIVVFFGITRLTFRTSYDFDSDSTIRNTNPQPAMTIDKSKQYFATLTTTLGSIQIRLYTKDSPLAVNNFIHLIKSNYYANTDIHRVVRDFMIQGGDPTNSGKGGPGYSINDLHQGILRRGTIAFIKTSNGTYGSQFFILQKCAPFMRSGYTAFGEVVQGLDIVDAIANTQTKLDAYGNLTVPTKEITILRTALEIHE